MAKIYAPNKQYTGISASVTFLQGVGETTNPHLIQWFKNRGYKVEEEEFKQEEEPGQEEQTEKAIEEMTVEELKAYAEQRGIDIGRSSSQEGILKKIQETSEEQTE